MKKNEVLVASVDKFKGKRDMSKIKCWNCSEMGHFRSKCNKQKKSKATTSSETPNSKKEGMSAAANAVESSSDDKGAWAAEETTGDLRNWFAEVVDAEDDVGADADWFDEIVVAMEMTSVLLIL